MTCPKDVCPKLEEACKSVPWEVANIVIINICEKCKKEAVIGAGN